MNLKRMYQKMAYKKALFTLSITAIYIVGTTIALPGVNVQPVLALMANNPNASFVLQMAGMSIDRMSLFSIGIGPWMSALILWRVLTAIKLPRIQNLTTKQTYIAKFIAAMIFGAIQGAGLILQTNMNNGSSQRFFLLLLIMEAGVALLIWLGNMNLIYGVGGSTIIVMAAMSRGFIQRIKSEVSLLNFKDTKIILIAIAVVIGVIIFSVFTLIFINGQLRLPIMRVLLDNRYESKSYFPIPVNPAGGMAFMYAFTIIALPQYIINIIQVYHPEMEFLSTIDKYLSQDNIVGVSFLIIMVILLSFAFAYVNVDTEEAAENMKKSGDYFPNVYPGKNTEKYLSDKLLRLAFVGALYSASVMGLPLLIGIAYEPIQQWTFLITMWSMWLILIQQVLIQFSSLYRRGIYSDFVKIKDKRGS